MKLFSMFNVPVKHAVVNSIKFYLMGFLFFFVRSVLDLYPLLSCDEDGTV